MEPLLKRLAHFKPLVADGGIGTLLMHQGLSPGGCPEAFNLERPDLLETIAGDYLEAGAELIQTNTFGASPLKLAAYGLEDKTEEINRKAVATVKRVVQGRAYISGSCGPTGGLLKPYGELEPETVSEGYRRQIRELVTAGVDVICVETMISLEEALLAVQAAKAVDPEIPVMATMTFDKTPRGYFTVMGVSVKAAVTGLENSGAEIIGSNCGNGIENMVEIAVELRKFTARPVVIRSNAGQPEMRAGEIHYPEAPEFFADHIPALLAAGVNIIGGCCGTTPEYVRRFREIVDTLYTVETTAE
ncbi:MAG: homocysteine S-methyltransferase family protein [Fidelibacterota bacterium]